MATPSFQRTSRRAMSALAFVFTSSNVVAADVGAADSTLRLTVASTYYALGSTRFNDLAAMDAWLLANRGRVGTIERCDSSGEPQILAAVGRLYPAPGQVLELRTLPSSAPDCMADGSAAKDATFVGFLRSEDYTATDEYGRSMIP